MISRFFFPEKIKAAKQTAQTKGKPLRVLFQDEARFGLITNTRRCWAPEGIRPTVTAQLTREYTYLFGTICPQDGQIDSLILPRMNKSAMTIFLEEISQRYSNDYILMFCDGAQCHHLDEVHRPSNIELAILPPYSPDLNPAENLWAEMREKYFHNHLFTDMDVLEEQMIEAANFYKQNPEIGKSLSQWPWIIKSF